MLNLSIDLPVRAKNAGYFVSPGHGIHPDRVISSYELILVRRGTLKMQEADRQFEINAGQTLVLWPGRRHRGLEPYSPDLAFYWIHFQLRRGQHRTKFHLPQLGNPDRPERLFELFHRFMDEQESESFQREEASLLLTLMLVEAARSGGAARSVSSPALVGRATAYIAENFRRPIGTGDVARALQFNPDYLNRIFQRSQGHSITEALHRLRVREARSLLRETSLNVEQVARAAGFNDARYFRRIFTRHQGVSPKRYRQFHARLHLNTR